MVYGEDYITRHYRTEWPDTDNVVISLYEAHDPVMVQIGIVEVRLFKQGEHRGEALIWNLYVDEQHRGRGYGRALLSDALLVIEGADFHVAALEWRLKESPHWVFDWYCREGFDEKEFGNGYALMKKKI